MFLCAEYSARQVKKSVVGHGAATKEQVQYMVKRLLNLTGGLQPDAADALAVALCHAHMREILKKLGMLNMIGQIRGIILEKQPPN